MKNMQTFKYGFPVFAAAFLLAMGRPSAVPLYYSFSGEVVYSNIASRVPGQTVNYTFLVDRAVHGHTLDGSGAASVINDDIEAVDFFRLSFLSQYIGGDALTTDNPASPIKESSFAGVDQVHEGEIFSAVRGSNPDPSGFDLIDIFSEDARIGDWTVGQKLRGENFVENAEGAENSDYTSQLTLVGISDINPFPTVPEPSALALFGFGVLGMGFLARRRP